MATVPGAAQRPAARGIPSIGIAPGRLVIPVGADRIPRHLTRAPVSLPLFEDLPDAVRDVLRCADTVADDLNAIAAATLQAPRPAALPAADRPRRGIHHALSTLYPPVENPIDLAASRQEAMFGAVNADALSSFCDAHTPEDVRASLEAISQALTGHAGLRNRSVCASPDRYGRYVVYPDVDGIDQRLVDLAVALRPVPGEPSAFHAMIALVGITNQHPFEDGNGRLSRLLANAQLSRGRPRLPYVPWREFSIFSRGGFILRVREAETRGDWLPLARYVLEILRAWRTLVATHAFRTSNGSE